MQQKYVFSLNYIRNWTRGFLPILDYASKPVNTTVGDRLFVWRNSVTDNYKISNAYL